MKYITIVLLTALALVTSAAVAEEADPQATFAAQDARERESALAFAKERELCHVSR